MKKISAFLFFLFFVAASLFFAQAAFAACQQPLTITPKNVPPDFKGNITIESNTDCFSTGNVKHRVSIHPQKADGDTSSYINYYNPVVTTGDKKNLNVPLALSASQARVKNNPGPWTVRVCVEANINECGPGSGKARSEGKIEIGAVPTNTPTPTPTPNPVPDDLPKIEFGSQINCSVHRGDAITLTKITNLRPNTQYNWFWFGEGKNTGFLTGPGQTTAEFTIPAGATNKNEGTYRLCIDFATPPLSRSADSATCKDGSNNLQNGIDIKISKDPLTASEQACKRVCVPNINNEECMDTCVAPGITCSGTAKSIRRSYVCNDTGTDFIANQFFCSADCSLTRDCTTSTAAPLPTASVILPIAKSTGMPPLPPCKKNGWVDAQGKEIPEPKNVEEAKTRGARCAVFSTGIADIATDPVGFVKTIFTILLSISGSIALILIIVSGYSLMFARGDAEKIQGAKETLTSAIVGLLFIIFALAILEFIGVDLLHLPGFGN